MQSRERISALSAFSVLLLVTLACSGAGGDSLLGPDSAGATAPFAVAGEIPIQEGLTLGADPEEIAVTRNTSESLQIVQLGMARRAGIESR